MNQRLWGLSDSAIPDDPSGADILAVLGEVYREQGVTLVLDARIGALGGVTPASLLDTHEGRRKVYTWALGLAEGVMG